MYIYDYEKIKQVKETLEVTNMTDNELCKFLYEIFTRNDQTDFCKEHFIFLGEGSARCAYLLKNTDIVIKFGMLIEDYESEICFQGAIEKNMYDKYCKNELCYKIYGISDNYGIIFCEKLETDLSLSNLIDYGLDDIYNYMLTEADAETLSEDEFYDMISEYIEDYLLDRGYDLVFDDIHIDNIGIDEDGVIKVLDLGYGDGSIAVVDLAEQLLQKDNKVIRGMLDFCGANLSEVINEYGGRNNPIIG